MHLKQLPLGMMDEDAWSLPPTLARGLDHIIVFGEAHFRRILGSYARY
jgi:hypothetical protein